MAYSEEHAQFLRDELFGRDGVSEKRMFGGLCCLLNGNMLCGVRQGGGMARVGKEHEATALKLDGIDPLSFTGRRMGGIVDISEAAIQHDTTRRAVLALAKDFVGLLPAK